MNNDKPTPISLDSADVLLQVSKAKVEAFAENLQSKHDPLTELELLKKLMHLIERRILVIKDKARDEFTNRFGGSQTERENGFVITLKTVHQYEYSDEVKDLETEIECLKSQLTQMRDKERKQATVTGSQEVLSLTFK